MTNFPQRLKPANLATVFGAAKQVAEKLGRQGVLKGRGFSRAVEVPYLCHSEGLQPRGISVFCHRRDFFRSL
jgi:uncharacterized protein (UPF0210 family)